MGAQQETTSDQGTSHVRNEELSDKLNSFNNFAHAQRNQKQNVRGLTDNEIGNLHFREGNLASAEASYRQAVACEKDEQQRVSAYSNLATVHWRQGHISKAIRCLQKAWALHTSANSRSSLTSTSPKEASLTTANILHQLGLCLALSKDFQQALTHLGMANEIRVRVNGSNHVSVGQTKAAMGKVHMMRGDWKSSLFCYTEALSCFKQANAPTLLTLQDMVRVLLAANRLERATDVLHEIIRVLKIEYSLCSDMNAEPENQRCRELASLIVETLGTLEKTYMELGQREKASKCQLVWSSN